VATVDNAITTTSGFSPLVTNPSLSCQPNRLTAAAIEI
jgi:hypothetical protein